MATQYLCRKNSAPHGALKSAPAGTGMHEVYYKTMIGNRNSFVQSLGEMPKKINQPKVLFYGSENEAIYEDLTVMNIQVFIVSFLKSKLSTV